MGPMTSRPDWYAYLRLAPGATAEELQRAVERISGQANALAATAPERSQLMRENIRAIKHDLLSGPEQRRHYDEQRVRSIQPAVPPPAAPISAHPLASPPPALPAPASGGLGNQSARSRLARFLRTGWTCPACGKGTVPSDKFCTKCGTTIGPILSDSAETRAPSAQPTCVRCANLMGFSDVFCSRCGHHR
jgi:Double zinc ribbon